MSREVAGCSSGSAHGPIPEQSGYSDASKLMLKDAVVYYESLLSEHNLISSECSENISNESLLIGEELYKNTLEILDEKQLVTELELLHMDEMSEEEICLKESDDNLSEEYYPDQEKSQKMNYIPLDYKMKVIKIAQANPKWSLKTLQRKGCHHLKRKDHLLQWEEEVKSGGSIYDKYSAIDSWTYDRFVEARQNYQQVTTKNLQQWALAAAAQYTDLNFKASDRWLTKFKKKHRISQRKVTKLVSQKESVSIEETLAAAETFLKQTVSLIPNFEEKYIINTDQTGCQYQLTYNRTLDEKGSKTVFVKRLDINKVTHSYTAQYAITLSGQLLPRVFLCLQESTGVFGPKIQKLVDEYSEIYTNVSVMSSKSGKLSSSLYRDFLIKCLKEYVGQNKFLLLIDSWKGQTNLELYDEIFQDVNKMPTCTIKVIPPKCTALVQPCDVYFYRQVKNLVKRMQNCAELIQQEREIHSREDIIKLHSIVHHQLSSPIFSDMIQYAWFASKLSEKRTIFLNVNEVCFPNDVLKKLCLCKKSSFICCARCRKNFCFSCFYDNYHCSSCK